MLGLTLRKEFRGPRLKGTAIELKNDKKTGATQISAADFLEITYPSADVLNAVEAVGPNQARPVVLIGERGQGKSHISGLLYHLLNDPSAGRSWLGNWAGRLDYPGLGEIPLREGMHIISESLHRQSYKFLWDLVFDNHPAGDYIRGKWAGMKDKKTEVPGHDLLLEMFREKPTALILDEYQTWFDGLTETRQYPWRTRAFNFIQILSDIAKEHPERLVLVVSVRNGDTDAYQQIHRVNPVLVDFKGPNAKQDRQRLLLHRLFENRIQVPPEQIRPLIENHISEYLRLTDILPADHEKRRQDFLEAWPYAPHLMEILEDQILLATHAQETRDLIKILAALYKRHSEQSPIITAADFRLNDGQSGVNALLDSVSDQHLGKLREKAVRNLEAVTRAVRNPQHEVPHLSEIIAALWVRSLAVSNQAGADPASLQVDITRNQAVDDNAFKVELDIIVENSFNIHLTGNRLIFKAEENPRAKLIANARNDKLFADGSDTDQLARETRAVIAGKENVAKAFRVIVLRNRWLTAPWEELEENDHPNQWDERIPLIVLPEAPDKPDVRMGKWLREHLQKRRNTVRFLLPQNGSLPLFSDRDLLILARVVVLAEKWGKDAPEYRGLKKKYEKELQSILKRRFDRFAILDTWNFAAPDQCIFQISSHKAQGGAIPDAVDKYVRENLFIPEDFEELVLEAAGNNESVGKLLRELQEPRPNQAACIPWLGETLIKERLMRVCARGRIAVNLRGTEYLQVHDGEDEEAAFRRLRGCLGTGRHLNETYILLPQAVPQAQGVTSGITEEDGLFAGGETRDDAPDDANDANDGETFADGGNDEPRAAVNEGSIFGGGADTGGKICSSPATSALNLLGQIEKWGINPGSQLQDFSIRVGNLTGAQANQLLRNLPDGMTFELTLKKEEN